MFAEGAGLTRQSIGEGCGSTTMVMSDARLSMFAAPMAEAIADMQNTTLPDCGRVLIGAMSADGLSLGWKDHAVPPVVIAPAEGFGAWRIRLSARAVGKMAEEVRRWPRVETGGVLMGRISEAARSFYVTDVLPAPDDSIRTASGFVLGTRGARAAIADHAESCGYSLFCLGTWHSHLMTSGPSSTDRATAAAVSLARLAPSVLVIHTPSGFRALLADGRSEDEIEGNAAGAETAKRIGKDHG
jgi:proteasome lid subunit RPN8/RPN11